MPLPSLSGALLIYFPNLLSADFFSFPDLIMSEANTHALA
jgi:hypothetical protein